MMTMVGQGVGGHLGDESCFFFTVSNGVDTMQFREVL